MRQTCSGLLRTTVYHRARIAAQHDARSKDPDLALRASRT
jgi:hypothetical protein